jgi:hypothetical protein
MGKAVRTINAEVYEMKPGVLTGAAVGIQRIGDCANE